MKKSNKFIIKQISLLISALITLAVTLVFITSIYGWYTTNNNASANSLKVSTENSNIHFSDYIQIKRYFVSNGSPTLQENNIYKRLDGTNTYYKWDVEKSSYITDTTTKARIPMFFDSLYPNEYLDVTLWYYPDQKYEDNDYTISLTNFNDTNGKFSETHTIDGSTEVKTFTHSVLGVYRVGEIITSKAEDGTETQGVSTWKWLCQYNGDYEDDTNFSFVTFKTGSFSDETKVNDFNGDKYYTTTFRIEFSLEQLNSKIQNVSTNALSEKYVTIGAIRLLG